MPPMTSLASSPVLSARSHLSISASQAHGVVAVAEWPEVGAAGVAGGDPNLTSLLLQLESERRLFNVPVIAFLVLLAVLGGVGNVCVLHVYRTRYHKTAGSFFITALAVLDLTSAALCVPFDIYDLSYPYTHPCPNACRIFRFLEYLTTVAAGLVLTCVAFSRYFKIVHPLHLYSAGQARSLVVVMVIMALGTCWPELVVRGTRTVRTRLVGVLGQDCGLSDWASGTVYPLIYYSVLLIIFFICFSIMLAFYGRIFCVVWKRSRTRIGERVPSAKNPRVGARGGGGGAPGPGGGGGEDQGGAETCGTRRYRRWSSDGDRLGSRGSLSDSERSYSSSQLSVSTISRHNPPYPLWATAAWAGTSTRGGRRAPAVGERSRRRKKRRRRRSQPPSHLGRTTRMLGLVTFVALLGYVPFLTVQVVALAGAGFQVAETSAYGHEMALQFCLKSHYLSSAANPLIYSVLSPTFRKESLVALKKAVSWLKGIIYKASTHS